MLVCLMLLSACDVNVKMREDVTNASESEALTVSTSDSTSETTTQIEPTTTPEPTTIPELTTTPESVTEPIVTQPLVMPPDFSEDFTISLNDILTRYQLNLNCDGNPEKCTCKPEFEEISEDGTVLTPRDRVLSLYFYDVESGYEYFVNPGVHYPVASIVKIPYCVYIYEKLTSGEISPELVIKYEKRHYFHGTGVIVKGSFGDEYTVLQLLKLAITESDNVAFVMLKDLSTWAEFEAYCAERGYSHETDLRMRKQKLCLESAGAAGRILAEFLRSDSEFVDPFKYDLTHTKNRMITSTYTVYRKYGWANFAFHDVAYVDAPYPYVLAILTNIGGEEKADYALYYELSMLIEEFSQAQRILPATE